MMSMIQWCMYVHIYFVNNVRMEMPSPVATLVTGWVNANEQAWSAIPIDDDDDDDDIDADDDEVSTSLP